MPFQILLVRATCQEIVLLFCKIVDFSALTFQEVIVYYRKSILLEFLNCIEWEEKNCMRINMEIVFLLNFLL